MERPEVSLENYEEVYEFYEEHEQSKLFARVAHYALAHVYKPNISCDEGTEEVIDNELRAGSRLILSPNHLTGDDQYVVVALAQVLKVLRPIRGNVFIPTEPSLFTRTGIRGSLLRRAVDELGAIPTFRLEDLRRRGIDVTPEIADSHQQAVLEASKVQVSKLINGSHMAGFWEGTRNRVDHREVQTLRKGIGHTAIAAAADVRVLLLPIGMYYGGEPTDYQKLDVPDKRTPHVHVGMPIPVATIDVDELVTVLHPAIQRCVDVAVPQAA